MGKRVIRFTCTLCHRPWASGHADVCLGPCPGCAERETRIAEMEKRPTHESIVQWLAEEHGTAAVPRYRAEFMEPTDAD